MTPDKIDTALLEATAGKWIVETDPPNTPTLKKRSYRHFVFIGTSGDGSAGSGRSESGDDP